MTTPINKVLRAKEILAYPFKGKYGLSPRQIEALEWALQGKPTPLMAAEMNLPEGTVKAHMSRALRKLGISKSELGWWVLGKLKEILK